MNYSVKEIFYTLQGEGAHAGRPAVFCRFSGCNLWSGREEDRKNAVCQFCDTDFIGTNGSGGGRFTSADDLAKATSSLWPSSSHSSRFVVCTGGEPLLQLDTLLIEALHREGFQIAVETNGTIEAPLGIDWICVSPKANALLRQTSGHELKLIYPQSNVDPGSFERYPFERFYLQPMDGQDIHQNTQAAITYCMEHPKWRLSIQSHKMLGLR